MPTNEPLPPIHLVLLAGGRSSRASRRDTVAPKQFRYAGRRMLFLIPAQELLAVPEVASLTVAVPDPWRAVAEMVLDEAHLRCPVLLASAGPHRTASTGNALRALGERVRPAGTDLVAVHDAARPFATRHLLRRVAAAAAVHGCAVPGVPVPDTIVRIAAGVDEGSVEASYLERETLQAVQTPQIARWELLEPAHAWCAGQGLSFTDDGGLLAVRGAPPAVVMGDAENWKITTESDWDRAESILAR
jgi:2-C-methyl-D-erythritol 4-phosphate cytidylyltransferase